jgi:hypothetical protein
MGVIGVQVFDDCDKIDAGCRLWVDFIWYECGYVRLD